MVGEKAQPRTLGEGELVPTKAKGILRSIWYQPGERHILFGGLIGMLIVDPISGAMYRIRNPSALVKLESASSDNRGLRIYSIDQIDEELKKDLIRIN